MLVSARLFIAADEHGGVRVSVAYRAGHRFHGDLIGDGGTGGLKPDAVAAWVASERRNTDTQMTGMRLPSACAGVFYNSANDLLAYAMPAGRKSISPRKSGVSVKLSLVALWKMQNCSFKA